MAVFLAASIPNNTVLAADAQRTGDTVTYETKTFAKINPQATPSQLPAGLPSATDGYAYFDAAAKKAYFLLTQGPAANSNTAEYVTYDMAAAGQYSRPSPSTTVTIVSAPAATAAAATQAGTRTSCDSNETAGVGWILCPVVNFLAKGMDYIYKVVSNFLVVRTITTDTDSSIYRMWSIVRDIANLCFVAAFLVIIYSQITGLGYSNYNLKKMLPRLVIGAILVNISFWVAAFAVDISNILGYSIHDMFTNVMKNLNKATAYGGAETPSWEAAALFVLGGGAVGGAIGIGGYAIAASSVAGALFLLAPTLVGVILAALVALIVLAARQALIVCLIIISPLAFAAMLLPNTEKYFDKWRGVFMTMLLLFPIFAAIFSGAQLAGMAIMQTADGNIVTIILGMAVQVAPIVVTPLLIKFSGGLVGRIAGMVNNPNKGLIDRTRKWSKDMADERRNKALTGRPNPDGTFTPLRRHAATRAIDRQRRKRDARRKNYEAGAENTYASSDAGMRLERQARDLGINKKNIETDVLSGREGHRIRTRETDAETRKKRQDASYERTTQAQHAKFRSQMADVRMSEAENIFNDSSMGHRIDSAKRTVDQTKQTIAAQHDLNWNRALINNTNLNDAEVRLRGIKGTAEVAAQSVSNMFDDHAMGHRVDHAKRKVERIKQTIAAEHERNWNQYSLNDSHALNQEMVLRLRNEEGALAKAKIDATYGELKVRKAPASIDSTTVDEAHRVAVETSLTNTRSTQAQSELTSTINKIILTNGTEYARDATTNEILLDSTGNKIVIGSPVKVDGKDIHSYAAGVGKHELMLANAVAADRADWGKQSQAAGELVAHFKLDSNQVQDLASKGEGTFVRALDDNGNEFIFDAGDEYVKEAAISKQFKAGSYGQKMAILKETGKKIAIKDSDGNITGYRKGHNYYHRATAQSDAIASGIAGLAPFINDVTYNEILKGNFNGDESIDMHALRQIFEGRLKASNLTGANQDALGILYDMGRLRGSSDPADQALYESHKSNLTEFFKDAYGEDSAMYKEAISRFDERFDDGWNGLLKTTKGIMENSTLNSNASDESKRAMRDILDDQAVNFKER